MSLFEYLMVLVSIVVGLGVAEILAGVARQIRFRHSNSGYWVHSCGVALIFLALLQTWWELWELNLTPEWTFLSLLLMLIAPSGLCLIAHLIKEWGQVQVPGPTHVVQRGNNRQVYFTCDVDVPA